MSFGPMTDVERQEMGKRFLKVLDKETNKPLRKPRTPDEVEGRTYVVYGPYIRHDVAKLIKCEPVRVTVAAKKVGNEIVYGISICSGHDNFTKQKGRRLAEERLANNFSRIDATFFPQAGEDWEQAIIRFASSLAEQATFKPERYKRKICKNCNEQK